MSMTKQVKNTFQSEFAGKKDANYNYKGIKRNRLIEWRKEKKSIVKVDKPLNIPRARELGYKAKEGVVVVRIRVRKGSGLHRRPIRGRRPKRMGVTKLTRRTNIKSMAEARVSKKYPNCEVLNSYKVGMDGKNHYYEVIIIDTSSPSIIKDKDLNWLCEPQHKGRADRGKTSAGKKHRGLRGKGEGYEKVRPSMKANSRKAK